MRPTGAEEEEEENDASALALIGRDGLFSLNSTMPELIDVTPGSTLSWREFSLDEQSKAFSWRNAQETKWVVFPRAGGQAQQGDYVVTWRDSRFFPTCLD